MTASPPFVDGREVFAHFGLVEDVHNDYSSDGTVLVLCNVAALLDCFRVPGESDCGPLYIHDAEAIRREVAAITERKWEEQLGRWLPLLLEAGHVQDCVAAYERFCPHYPRPTRGAARPRQNHSPAALCYLLAREQVNPGSTGQDRERLFDDYLKRNVDKLLDRGAYTNFARWVFLASEAPPGEPAQQAIQQYADRYA
jgi:hypothetical protein